MVEKVLLLLVVHNTLAKLAGLQNILCKKGGVKWASIVGEFAMAQGQEQVHNSDEQMLVAEANAIRKNEREGS